MNPKTDAIFTPNLFYIRLYGATNTIVGLEPSTFLDFIMSLIHLLIWQIYENVLYINTHFIYCTMWIYYNVILTHINVTNVKHKAFIYAMYTCIMPQLINKWKISILKN